MPYFIKQVLLLGDFLTGYLNEHSEWFKGSKDQRVVATYDTIKRCFYEIRLLWDEANSVH